MGKQAIPAVENPEAGKAFSTLITVAVIMLKCQGASGVELPTIPQPNTSESNCASVAKGKKESTGSPEVSLKPRGGHCGMQNVGWLCLGLDRARATLKGGHWGYALQIAFVASSSVRLRLDLLGHTRKSIMTRLSLDPLHGNR